MFGSRSLRGAAIIRRMIVDGRAMHVMIDTGCSLTLASEHAVREYGEMSAESVMLETMSGFIKTRGSVMLRSVVYESQELGSVSAHVLPKLPLQVDLVMGLDVILRVGLQIGGKISSTQVRFGVSDQHSASVSVKNEVHRPELSVSDVDYGACFSRGVWEVEWRWREDRACLKTSFPHNVVSAEDIEEFDSEVTSWVDNGILIMHDEEKHGPVRNFVPMLGIRQKKGDNSRVRPVLDYRDLNKSIKSNPGGSVPICADRIREWRQVGSECAVVDLKRAYLQIGVKPSLWTYQAVRWKGHTYLLTKLGFGLATAPKIMTAIVESILAADDTIKQSVTSYIDDLFVDKTKVSSNTVIEHLKQFGLEAKEAQELGRTQGVRILGLKVDNRLRWKRDSPLPDIPTQPTRRQVHGIVGEWCGHFPVAGWLRVACGYLQRCTAEEKLEWDETVTETILEKLKTVDAKLRVEGDPVRGGWLVDKSAPITVWADASSLAIGVVLHIGGEAVEDAAWLLPKDNTAHINRSELDAVIRGLNMALKWGRREILIRTDSLTVYRWLQAVINKTHNVKSGALEEVLIRRRLCALRDIIEEEKLSVSCSHVRSEENKADALTRVPKKWLEVRPRPSIPTGFSATLEEVREVHNRSHMGVQRTYELAKDKWADVSRETVERVVRDCLECASIDPPVTHRWERGHIKSSSPWELLSVDITHVGGVPYLTLVDVASRFTIWRKLANEAAETVVAQIRQVFAEFGPPQLILSDNGTVFLSGRVKALLREWEVGHRLSCAYRPQGNSVVERMHRTIKRSVARTGRTVEEATFWYNGTRGNSKLSPHETLFLATPRRPGVNSNRIELPRPEGSQENQESAVLESDMVRNPFVVGDLVYLRPPSGRCDLRWDGPHRVTEIRSAVNLEVGGDGVSRHVSHLRLIPGSRRHVTADGSTSSSDVLEDEMDFVDAGGKNEVGSDNALIDADGNGRRLSKSEDDSDVDEIDEPQLRRSLRERRVPVRFEDYVVEV